MNLTTIILSIFIRYGASLFFVPFMSIILTVYSKLQAAINL